MRFHFIESEGPGAGGVKVEDEQFFISWICTARKNPEIEPPVTWGFSILFNCTKYLR